MEGGEREHDTLVAGSPRRGFFLRYKFPIIAVVILVIALAIVATVVLTARMTDDEKPLDQVVQVNNLMGHLQELQKIAIAHGNTRAAATPGYNLSVSYVLEQLKNTDYNVTVQDFTIAVTTVSNVANMTIKADAFKLNLPYVQEFYIMGSPAGFFDINTSITQVVGYGCEASDYANVVEDSIALVKRGNCTFVIKANLAATMNPKALLIHNEGNTPDRLGVIISSVSNVTIPILSTSYYTGNALYNDPSAIVAVSFQADVIHEPTMNIIAETKYGRDDRIILIGSHLDSVPAGPGINDNGSGSALNLELALQLATKSRQEKLKNKIRFCWWGAEELGLLGSVYYVHDLLTTNQPELAKIAVNLNFDMIGSPNFIRQVYNGTSDPKSPGSGVVQNLFNAYYGAQKLAVLPTAFDGRSDYGPFLDVGIPAGGLATGAEAVKTIAQRTMFGGLAGAWLDPCYHQACDTVDNINQAVYQDMARGAAHVVEILSSQEDLIAFLNQNQTV